MKNFVGQLGELSRWNNVVDYLCQGITDGGEFRNMIEYVILYKIEGLQKGVESLYESEEESLELILPTFKRVWAKVFINTPDLFEMPEAVIKTPGYIPDRRLELYQISFDIDQFIEYLEKMLVQTQGLLNDFIHLDRTKETLTLIVDNYISGLVQNVTHCQDINAEIRELKLKKVIEVSN